MKDKVIAVFDVGRTNKKILLFDYDLNIISEEEERFPEINDDDGFACDDIEKIEKWISAAVKNLLYSDKYDLTAVNFATYGATLAYLDSRGKLITPIYNSLKPIDDRIPEKIYRRSGGQDEFCRRTASPALGMLNSGMQALWLKNEKPSVFNNVAHILHFPQYLSYLLTGRIYSEHTSIGCHTALWDFDKMDYHHWTTEEGFKLPPPSSVNTLNEVAIGGKKISVGIGIHDSSASLAPYIAGSRGKFLLISTGTWCINMNPYNTEKLTAEQLDKDCLCYMSITRQPVKSSRLFLGNLHEVAVKRISDHFGTAPDFFKSVNPDKKLIEICRKKCGEKRFYFADQPFSRRLVEKNDFFTFKTCEEAYHQLMVELVELTVEAIDLVIPSDDDTENVYITGGFSKNPLFLRLLADAYSMKNVYTSEINNATALGAALVVLNSLDPDRKPALNLGLNQY
ncbi:MAG: FGGY family carbohydrate kinase [Bacteroidales bacterium]|jgi:sugar (pentulose or hexulose) kinase|nr:FGGY family carbohydrate kinase [Bacteroidales bacterium]